MAESPLIEPALAGARVDPEVLILRPDYRALLVVVRGVESGPSDRAADELLREAEASARDALADSPLDSIPHVAAWRDAYRAFGAKPTRTRNSLESLMRRAAAGLPRVNRVTDTYNAISVLHRIPIGGEDLARYSGAPRLVRAAGDEPFATTAAGEAVIEYPQPGEVVWRDDDQITCRRWNWRQCRHTQLTESTTDALFILDALAPVTDDELAAAGAALVDRLTASSPKLTHSLRVVPAHA